MQKTTFTSGLCEVTLTEQEIKKIYEERQFLMDAMMTLIAPNFVDANAEWDTTDTKEEVKKLFYASSWNNDFVDKCFAEYDAKNSKIEAKKSIEILDHALSVRKLNLKDYREIKRKAINDEFTDNAMYREKHSIINNCSTEIATLEKEIDEIEKAILKLKA